MYLRITRSCSRDSARYLDPMLGLWTSVDPARQFSSPYLYAGNGVNPVNKIDPDGNAVPLVVAVGFVLVRNIAIRTVTKMATVTLPSIAMKAADIASKAQLPANLKYAAAAGFASETASRMNKRLEKGFDDVVDFLGNALSDPATTTFNFTKTTTQDAFDNPPDFKGALNEVEDAFNQGVNSINQGMDEMGDAFNQGVNEMGNSFNQYMNDCIGESLK